MSCLNLYSSIWEIFESLWNLFTLIQKNVHFEQRCVMMHTDKVKCESEGFWGEESLSNI